MNHHPMHRDVLVIGGGVIGLAIAWRCAQRGLAVTVVDPAPGSGASTTAAGMLAPVTELNYGELPLLRLGIESARLYPAFVDEVEQATGHQLGYRPCGTLVAAWDGADLAGLRDLHALQTSLGLSAEMITGRELRRLEPALAPGLPGGLFAADDHQIDNRLLHKALLDAVEGIQGVSLVPARVAALIRPDHRVTGVLLESGEQLAASTVVLAAGAWAGRIDGVPADVVVRPVKGQTLRLRTSGEPVLTHIVRASIKGSRVYAVPRADGEVVVGASSEEVGFDLHPRAGAIYELLRDVQSLVPVLGEARFGEVSTSLRPAAPDNAPIIGQSSLPGLILAVGHYRNGILLTPITGVAVADLITTGTLPDAMVPFTPGRFNTAQFAHGKVGG
jgi:glycine oxidase